MVALWRLLCWHIQFGRVNPREGRFHISHMYAEGISGGDLDG